MNEKTAQTKSEMKAQRIKAYFVNAAKEIIVSEGVQHVSVRRIAQGCEYSYGTIYNYFDDLDALLAQAKGAIIADIVAHMGNDVQDEPYGVEDIKAVSRQFVDFFIDNRNIYDFLYNHHLEANAPSMFDGLDIGETGYSMYDGLVDAGIIRREDVPAVAKAMIYGYYGLLSLYFSSNGVTKEKVHEDLDQMTDYILSPRRA